MNKFCKFCKVDYADSEVAVVNGDGVAICEGCVNEAKLVLQGDSNEVLEQPKVFPKELIQHADKYVIGQEEAKRTLAVALALHSKYHLIDMQMVNGSPIKMNTLLVGPTGTGKTHLTETMARGLGLPFVTVDCTSVTAAGYIGDSVDTILQTLINKADGDVKLAEKGVVFLDEIDKLRAKGETASTNKDPGGEQVQDSLLKLIEGTIMRVPTENLGVRSTTPYVEINTSGILFIAGGAFKGLDKIVEERLNSDKASGIGFGADLRTMEERSPEELQTCISNQDISKYGLKEEFIGRFSNLAKLLPLTDEQYELIIRGDQTSPFASHKLYAKAFGVDLKLTDSGVKAITEKCRAEGIGARGIFRIMNESVIEVFSNIEEHIGSIVEITDREVNKAA
ncbi:AAA family ATPase [Vibrio fortis]|uniref:AAA family ATPase n=1 Tax=Vibrio fortis TaxID=212667 RepID=UPI00406920F5